MFRQRTCPAIAVSLIVWGAASPALAQGRVFAQSPTSRPVLTSVERVDAEPRADGSTVTVSRRPDSNPALGLRSIEPIGMNLAGVRLHDFSPSNIGGDGFRYAPYPASARQTLPGAYGFEGSPNAGFGLTFRGGPTDTGVRDNFGGNRASSVAQSLGLHTVEEASFAGHGRWLIYAEANGQIVGMNMTSNDQGGPQSAGWTAESSSAQTNDTHAGIGWRSGNMLASFGYVRHEFKGATDLSLGLGQGRNSDSMMAFSLVFHPR